MSAMCKVMALSRSSYYDWLYRPESDRAKEDEEVSKMINEVFVEGRATYGARRIRKKLIQKKVIVSRRRIGRLMNVNVHLNGTTFSRQNGTTQRKKNLLIFYCLSIY